MVYCMLELIVQYLEGFEGNSNFTHNGVGDINSWALKNSKHCFTSGKVQKTYVF